MKGNKKILVIAILLLLISVTFTTYAIYRTGMSGTGTATAANWEIKFKKGSDTEVQNLNFTAADVNWTTNPSAVSGKIAPGATGTITFTIDATGTETDVYYLAELGAGATSGISVSMPSDTEQLLRYSATNMTATVTVTVTWNGAVSDSVSKDESDLALESNSTISIPITVTARQSVDNPTT